MKQTIAFFATVAAAALLSHATPALTQQAASTASVPANIAGAIADTNRPQTDKNLDAQRKPAEMLTFAGVKAGDKVLEFVPGRGYVTRLLAKAVGTAGHSAQHVILIAAVYANVGISVPDEDAINASVAFF